MKTLATSIIFTAALVAQPVLAHSDQYNECDMQVHGSLQYNHGELTITTDDGEKVHITPDYQLYIDGQSVSLNDEQQRWVADYHHSIETAIPMTVEIAKDGIQIASYAVTEVFSELLGADNSLSADFDDLFADLSVQIDERFNASNNSYTFDGTGMEGDWFDESWDESFDERVEALVERSMGHILMAIGSQMIFGDGDGDAFANRMENMGEMIEAQVEDRASELEYKAEELCTILAKADYAETRMQKHIPGLNSLDLLEVGEDYQLEK